ncbi:endonuclease/exonuclease/phosphatase family protein [Mucilaginibacter sp. KACC 22063]|uniref:endonuclease/exonuclease/phosphatase family protein n=1 Tax=Mucilaginibacter sp. KACC 22063 TaxID=3025666 RepID=UPI00236645EE|nr:endonuclease/exonuclease/phosphatase family protein [Mucilaginibacter sp. KACC 22063]WDF53599.1 endonuclease/exonuclease/phosphatase family protein [Mucilaginibacter sp. KACC 22063]
MKLIRIALVALIMLLFMQSATHAQKLIVGSFNLRYDNPADTGNLWRERAPAVTSLIRFHDFDVLGTQEGKINQLQDLVKALPEYARYGVGRDDGKEGGEHSAIFYKKDRFTLLGKGDFWLSQTPDKPSLGWDATCCNRICSWVYLQDKQSGKKFWYFNGHFDHQGVVAREESSKLILKKIKEIAGNGMVLLTGDFNGGNDSSWYLRIANSGVLIDTYKQAKYPYGYNPTYHDFGKQLKGNEIIDHIFATSQFKVKRWGILSDSNQGKYPSDHFPVLAELAY